MMIETLPLAGTARFTRHVPGIAVASTVPAMPRRSSARSSAACSWPGSSSATARPLAQQLRARDARRLAMFGHRSTRSYSPSAVRLAGVTPVLASSAVRRHPGPADIVRGQQQVGGKVRLEERLVLFADRADAHLVAIQQVPVRMPAGRNRQFQQSVRPRLVARQQKRIQHTAVPDPVCPARQRRGPGTRRPGA